MSSTGHLTFLLHDTIRQSSGYSRSQLSGYGTHDDFERLPLPSDSHSYSPHAMIHQTPEKFEETKEQILRKCMWWTITWIQFLRRGTATSESRFRRNISGIHCSSQNVFTHHHMHNFMLVFLWLPPALINSMAGAEKGLNFRFLIALVYTLVLAFCKPERKWKGGLAYPSLTSQPPFMLLRNSNISFKVTKNVQH